MRPIYFQIEDIEEESKDVQEIGAVNGNVVFQVYS